MMWFQYLTVAMLVAMSRDVWGREKCACSHVEHPQFKYCSSETQYAYRVEILNGGSLPAGIPKEGSYSYWKYVAQVIETFKGEDYLPEDGDDIIDIYTPALTLCGELQLYDTEQEEGEEEEQENQQYLVTGTVELGFNETRPFLSTTSCMWVARWDSLTPEQMAGLRGDYHQCNSRCYPVPTSAGLLSNEPARSRFQVRDCLFNPVTAGRMKVEDCETMYGYCDQDDGNEFGELGCHWRSTNAYLDCYNRRRSELSSNGKPAIAVKQDCKAYSGRKRKLCLMKFLKAQQRARRNR